MKKVKNIKYSILRYLRHKLHYFKDDEIFASKFIHLPRGFNDVNKRAKLIKGYRDELLIQDMISLVKENTMVTYDGLALSVDLIRYINYNNIAGNIVELGTWKGGSLALLAHANVNYKNNNRVFWGFDSFEGIPSPDSVHDKSKFMDNEFKLNENNYDNGLIPVNQLVASISDVYQIINELELDINKFKIIKGWFQNTLPVYKNEISKIAILRMDGDLYHSYKIPLEILYENVVQGGFIVFDDWMLKGCRNAVLEFFESLPVKPFIHKADYSVRYIQKI